jgi:CRP/FNR family transcriptional regulator
MVLGLPQRYLDVWMMRYVSWKNFVLSAYDERLNELLRTIDQITFHGLDERLLDYLRERAELHPDRSIAATHQEIANDLHVSREAVSRLLKSFERRGVVELGRNRVWLRG